MDDEKRRIVPVDLCRLLSRAETLFEEYSTTQRHDALEETRKRLNRLKELHINAEQQQQRHHSKTEPPSDPFLSISHLMECQRRLDALVRRNSELLELEAAQKRREEEEEAAKAAAEEEKISSLAVTRQGVDRDEEALSHWDEDVVTRKRQGRSRQRQRQRRSRPSRRRDADPEGKESVIEEEGRSEGSMIDMEDLVQRQRDQQAHLTLEIMKMAQTLRENCLHSLNIVQDDNKLLDGLEEKTEDSIHQLASASKKVADQGRRSNWISNVFLFALIFLFSSFLMMHTLIRATSAVVFW